MKVGAQATGAEDQIPSPRPEPESESMSGSGGGSHRHPAHHAIISLPPGDSHSSLLKVSDSDGASSNVKCQTLLRILTWS